MVGQEGRQSSTLWLGLSVSKPSVAYERSGGSLSKLLCWLSFQSQPLSGDCPELFCSYEWQIPIPWVSGIICYLRNVYVSNTSSLWLTCSVWPFGRGTRSFPIEAKQIYFSNFQGCELINPSSFKVAQNVEFSYSNWNQTMLAFNPANFPVAQLSNRRCWVFRFPCKSILQLHWMAAIRKVG